MNIGYKCILLLTAVMITTVDLPFAQEKTSDQYTYRSADLLTAMLSAQEETIETYSFEFNNTPLEKALQEVARQGGLKILTNSSLIPKNLQVSGQYQNLNVAQAFSQLLENTSLDFLYSGNGYIIIVPKIEEEKIFQQTISGTVTDSQTGEALPGVNVIVVGSEEATGSTIGTNTDLDGQYEVQVPDDLNTLVFTFVGYQRTEVQIEGRTEINVELATDVQMLEDIVVVGYGAQRSDELTGSISRIESDDFVEGAVTDAAQLIQGKLAGVNIVKPSGDPISDSEISLRGVTTLMGNADPLILIDGVPGTLREVSPQEISSIDVLKDGAAAAIYGTRGSNGVILITTENVTGNISPTIEVNSYVSTQSIIKELDVMNASEYRELVRQGLPGATDHEGNTDWVDLATQRPITQSYDVSLKGGNQATNYVLSLRFNEEEGLMRNSNNQMIQPRLQLNHEMFNGILDLNGKISGFQQNYFPGDFRDGYFQAIKYNPTAPVRTENGEYFQNFINASYHNPISRLDEVKGETQRNRVKLQGSATFDPTDFISLTMRGSRNVLNHEMGRFETSEHVSTVLNSQNGVATRNTIRQQEDLLEIIANYLKNFAGKHEIRALGGYSWINNEFESFSATNSDFPADQISFNSLESGNKLREGQADLSSLREEDKLVSYFGRFNYSYDNRYLLMTSIRREGSSKFGSGNKWANFPSVSVGWNIHNEGFMNNVETLNKLRLRSGFGVTGNVPEDPYLSLSLLSFDTKTLVNGEWVPAITTASNPNPNLKWETKKEVNFGIDIGLFDNRITGSVDVYQRNTDDMLWRFPVPSPPFLHNDIVANAAQMENRGLEVQVNTVPFQSTVFQWNSSINYSTNQNEITSLSGGGFTIEAGFFDTGWVGTPVQQESHRVEIGEPIGNFYGFKAIDIDDDGFWIIESEDGTPKSFRNQQPNDKQILGNAIPDHYLNFNNTLRYKKIDFTLQMRGAFGFQILNEPELFLGQPVHLGRGNVLADAFDDVFGKRPVNQNQSLEYNSTAIEDGDYWKVSNITLGYSFDADDVSSISFLNNARIYVAADNLWTFTGYSGIDPEVSVSGLSPGVDSQQRFPTTRTFTLGVSLRFQ